MERSANLLQNELREEKRKNELLRSVSLELGKLSTLEVKLNNILALLDDRFQLKHTILLFPAKNNSVLRVIASRGFADSGVGEEVPFNYGIVGVVASRKKKLRVSRLSQYRRYASAFLRTDDSIRDAVRLPSLEHAESQVAMPLLANNELVAVLSCESENIQFFHQRDEEFLMTLSQQIALSIQNTIVFGELEKRVKRRTEELENLNKTKDKLFAIVGHDLRSPVISLVSVAELFEFYRSQGKIDQMLALAPKISYAAKNMSQLLDNLLNWALSQQDGIKCVPQKIDIHDLVRDVHDLFVDYLISKNIEFVHTTSDTAVICADYNMIFSVLRNVIGNAIKFTPSQGRIEVSSHERVTDIEITIRDTGPGISEDKIETLFSFHENKSTLGTHRERGSGLGLVLVNEFMQINNGTIHIDSSDEGTSIQLFLPKA